MNRDGINKSCLSMGFLELWLLCSLEYGLEKLSRLDRVQVKRVFERFYTVESAKNSTGLGLSIARLLMEKMGGDIKADYIDGELIIQIEV